MNRRGFFRILGGAAALVASTKIPLLAPVAQKVADKFTRWEIGTTTKCYFGIDNSESDTFQITYASSGTTNLRKDS